MIVGPGAASQQSPRSTALGSHGVSARETTVHFLRGGFTGVDGHGGQFRAPAERPHEGPVHQACRTLDPRPPTPVPRHPAGWPRSRLPRRLTVSNPESTATLDAMSAASESIPDRGPRTWTGPVAAGALLLATVLALFLSRPADPDTSAEPGEFSVERAWAHIEPVARAPHPVGSVEHDRVRSYLVSELRALGLEVDPQTVEVNRRRESAVQSAVVRNVVARRPGTGPTGTVLLMSHYDAADRSYGAADAGIGVATILETARQLSLEERPRNDVVFLITDAEERGLLGAMGFARTHPWMESIDVVLNFEARGTSGPAAMFETGPGSGWLIREYARHATRPVTSSLFPEAYRRLPNDTDFTVFRERGIPGLNFAIGESAHWYHTPGDRPENLSPASLQHMGDNALALTRRLSEVDLQGGRSDDPVFFSVPGLGLITYSAGLAVPLAVLLVGVYVAVAVFAGRRGRLGWWGIPAGLVGAVVATAAAAGAAYGIWALAAEPLPDGRPLHRQWPYVVGFAALAGAAMFGVFAVLRRWLRVEELSLGALLVPVALAVASAVWFVGGSYLFLWPALLALGALALEVGAEDGKPVVIVVAQVALGAAIVIGLAPMVHFVGVFLSAAAGYLIAGLTAVTLVLLLPLLDTFGRPNRVWLPLSGLIVALLLVGWEVAGAGPPPRAGEGPRIFHVQDVDRGRAVWAAPLSEEHPMVDRLVGEGIDTIGLGLYSRYFRGRYRVARAPSWEPGSAGIRVVGDEVRAGRRVLNLVIAPDSAPVLIELSPDTGYETQLLDPLGSTAAGARATEPLEDRWLVIRAGGEPFELTLATTPGDSIGLVLSRHYLGLPAGLQPGAVLGRRVVRETVRF